MCDEGNSSMHFDLGLGYLISMKSYISFIGIVCLSME